MNDWFIDWHHLLLLRFLSLVLIFGVFWPSLLLLWIAGRVICRRVAGHVMHGGRLHWGDTS
jgi:hypothetical protein